MIDDSQEEKKVTEFIGSEEELYLRLSKTDDFKESIEERKEFILNVLNRKFVQSSKSLLLSTEDQFIN